MNAIPQTITATVSAVPPELAERVLAGRLAGRIKQYLNAGQRPSLAEGRLSDDDLLLIYRALKLFPARQVAP